MTDPKAVRQCLLCFGWNAADCVGQRRPRVVTFVDQSKLLHNKFTLILMSQKHEPHLQ